MLNLNVQFVATPAKAMYVHAALTRQISRQGMHPVSVFIGHEAKGAPKG